LAREDLWLEGSGRGRVLDYLRGKNSGGGEQLNVLAVLVDIVFGWCGIEYDMVRDRAV